MIKTKIKLTTLSDISEFMKITTKINDDIDICKGRYIVDGKSVMGVFSLDMSDPVDLYIHSDDKELLELFRKWIVE